MLSSLLSPSMALHWADIGDVLGNVDNVESSVSVVSAALATSSSCGRNVVTKGVMVSVSSAARLVVGFCMEKPWLRVVVVAARQVMRRALEVLIVMV